MLARTEIECAAPQPVPPPAKRETFSGELRECPSYDEAVHERIGPFYFPRGSLRSDHRAILVARAPFYTAHPDALELITHIILAGNNGPKSARLCRDLHRMHETQTPVPDSLQNASIPLTR